MKYLRLAVSFLTILPVRPVTDYQPGDTGRAAVYFPWVGLLLSLMVVLSNALLRLFLPLPLTTVLTVTLWAVLSGFLHLDGLSDCADALPAAVSKERRLEILKDPRTGSFAVVSLILYFLVKSSALLSLQAKPFWHLALIVSVSMVLARWMMVLLAATQPSARPGGMGDEFKLGLSKKAIFLSALLPVILCVISTIVLGWPVVGIFILLPCLTVLIARTAKNRLGGITGDVIGMTVELSEVFALILFSIR